LKRLRRYRHLSHIPAKYFTTFLLLGCGHIWKRRNNNIFRDELAACKTEAYLWGARLPRDDRAIAASWCFCNK
jgi:hypothetical protein